MRRVVGPALIALIAGCSTSAPAPEPSKPTVDTTAHVQQSRPQVESVDAPKAEPKPVRQEPNDDRSTATPLALGVAVEGHISRKEDPAQGDQDWFVLTVPGTAPSVLSVSLQGPSDLDTVLEWMAPSPRGKKDKALIQADVVRKKPGDELLANLRVQPGPVYLRVRSAWYRNTPRKGSDEAYTLTADILPWAESIEAEPNEALEDAVVGTFDRPARGTLGHIGDRDTWRFPVTTEPGTRLQLKVAGLSGVKMETEVYWRSQERDVIRTKGHKGEGLTNRNLAVPEGASPELIVRLRATAGAAPNVAYDIQLTAEPPSEAPTEAEPNDKGRLATPMAINEQLTGFFDRPSDVDHVTVEVDKAITALITLTPPRDVRGTLEVVKPDGTTALTRSADAKGKTLSALGIGLTPGKWLLRLRGKPSNGEQPYRLQVVPTSAEGSEREPNDESTSTSLSPLVSKGRVTGWIHPAGDRDLWTLERSEERGPGIVTFQVDPPPGVKLDVTLNTLEGDEVTGRRGIAAGQPGTFTHFLAPGRYTVHVTGSTDKTYADSPYSLRLLD